LIGHDGPVTPALRAVRRALADYYSDLAVVDGIIAWRQRQQPQRRES
jgi:hypothetical protein